jgi:hypothetical protein
VRPGTKTREIAAVPQAGAITDRIATGGAYALKWNSITFAVKKKKSEPFGTRKGTPMKKLVTTLAAVLGLVYFALAPSVAQNCRRRFDDG